MSPKSLTTQEKMLQKEKLFAKGRELLIAYGVRKTSVEDIMKAANMAKGSFYQHFESKEAFFFELIVQFHHEWFQKAGEAFAQPSGLPLKERVREHIRFYFHSPEYLAIFKYHEEIEELIYRMQELSQEKVDALMELEHNAYEQLLQLCRIDTRRVKAGVIHNYLHAIYFGIANLDLIEKDFVDATFEALLNGLIIYIFGGDS
jgi:AcrR family transcriptional regulator